MEVVSASREEFSQRAECGRQRHPRALGMTPEVNDIARARDPTDANERDARDDDALGPPLVRRRAGVG
jgi:hypothetical protein